MVEEITIDVEMLHNHIECEWEPLWDDVFEDIPQRIMGHINAISNVRVSGVSEQVNGVMHIYHGDIPHDLIANGLPIRELGEWTLAHDGARPQCRAIPVTIASRLHTARVLNCEYNEKNHRWCGSFKLRFEDI